VPALNALPCLPKVGSVFFPLHTGVPIKGMISFVFSLSWTALPPPQVPLSEETRSSEVLVLLLSVLFQPRRLWPSVMIFVPFIGGSPSSFSNPLSLFVSPIGMTAPRDFVSLVHFLLPTFLSILFTCPASFFYFCCFLNQIFPF